MKKTIMELIILLTTLPLQAQRPDGLAFGQDSVGNPIAVIGAHDIWMRMPYNRKYGFGGFPRGKGRLPYYNGFRGVLEADMLSARGGRGRWNHEDTGNFRHGGHLFEGWNQEEDARLTMGIGLNYGDIGWIQVFHPAEEGDARKYYGVTKVGSDIDDEGVDFMPSIALGKAPIAMPVLHKAPSLYEKDLEVLLHTRQVDSVNVNMEKKTIVGTMYYDATDNALKVYTPTGWRTLAFESGQTVIRLKVRKNSPKPKVYGGQGTKRLLEQGRDYTCAYVHTGNGMMCVITIMPHAAIGGVEVELE